MRAGKVDANQVEITEALRAAGYSVLICSNLGRGVPDLLAGGVDKSGTVRCWLLEIKDGNKRPSARRLTPDQVKWHAAWKGQKAVVSSVAEALAALV